MYVNTGVHFIRLWGSGQIKQLRLMKSVQKKSSHINIMRTVRTMSCKLAAKESGLECV